MEPLYTTIPCYFQNSSFMRKFHTIKDVLDKVYVLRWDRKNHKHTIISLQWIDYINDGKKRYKHIAEWQNACATPGDPVVFDTPEQEKEFLTYHPDVKNWKYIRRIESLCIEKRGNRWFWKPA